MISIKKITGTIFFLLLFACAEPNSIPFPSAQDSGVISGQVFNLSHPGPIPVGWEPPAYETICTVIAQDPDQNIYIESRTNFKGVFSITAPAGKYYLRVKDSAISSVTGPYILLKGGLIEAKAYYDNGMR